MRKDNQEHRKTGKINLGARNKRGFQSYFFPPDADNPSLSKREDTVSSGHLENAVIFFGAFSWDVAERRNQFRPVGHAGG